MNRLLKLTLLLTLVLSALPASAQTDPNRFGVVEGFWFPDLTCELDVGWERIIFDWAQHQPNEPTDWYTLNVDDRWLKNANRCNREVVGLLKNTPAWASTGIPGAGVPQGLYLPVDDPDNHWANFVRQTAHYYAPRGVHRFIIWNEPDIAPDVYGFEFAGSLDDYARLVEVAYLAAKQGNPAAEIHLSGMTYWHDVNSRQRLYLDRLLEQLTADESAAEHGYYFDAVSLHVYFRTDSVYDIVTEARELLAQHGLAGKAIWINETNAPPTQDPDWPVDRPVYPYTLEQQASFLVQAAALSIAADAERVAVYKLYDQELPEGAETFGILSPADATRRPAYDAWQTVTTRFRDVTTATRAASDLVDAVLMQKADGAYLLAAWARTGENTDIIIGDASGQYTQQNGETSVQDFTGSVQLTLPAANCNGDDPAVPCPVGGPVSIITLDDLPAVRVIGTDEITRLPFSLGQ